MRSPITGILGNSYLSTDVANFPRVHGVYGESERGEAVGTRVIQAESQGEQSLVCRQVHMAVG